MFAFAQDEHIVEKDEISNKIKLCVIAIVISIAVKERRVNETSDLAIATTISIIIAIASG